VRWLAWLKSNWASVLGVSAAAAVLASPRAVQAKSTTENSPSSARPPKHYTGFASLRKVVQEVAKAAGLDYTERQWLERFAVIQASSESGANNYRGLGVPERFPVWAVPSGADKKDGRWVVSPAASTKMRSLQTNEAKAAVVAYERNEGRGSLPPGDFPLAYWTLGSGGYFGFIPANGAYAFRSSTRPNEFGPLDVFDAHRSVVMLMRTIAALAAWSTFKKLPENDQVTGLKRAMASPTLIPEPNAERSKSSAAKARAAASKRGIPASFFDQPMPSGLRKRSRNWVELVRKVEGRS